ncbi:MAG: hypothetical protein IKI64_01880, partial [Clostridia bacterium]|nr:hypothetical protein [Clostridia bacterium]
QSFISHGLYDHLLELAGVFLVWYSFWHIKSPHLLVLYHMSNKWGAVHSRSEGLYYTDSFFNKPFGIIPLPGNRSESEGFSI